jgi:hypothetical protein
MQTYETNFFKRTGSKNEWYHCNSTTTTKESANNNITISLDSKIHSTDRELLELGYGILPMDRRNGFCICKANKELSYLQIQYMEFYVSITKLLEKLLYSLTCPLTGEYGIMQKQLLAERIERLFFEVNLSLVNFRI